MNRKPRKKTVDPQAGSDPDDIRRSLDALVRTAAGKVPPEVMAKVLSIRKIIQGMLPSSGHFPPGSPEFFLIERTATSYLPTALEGYMRLPRAYAATHPVQDGKTPKEILLDQLTLLEGKMTEIAVDVHRSDVDRLLAHGRFLEERLGRSPLKLRPPAGSNDR